MYTACVVFHNLSTLSYCDVMIVFVYQTATIDKPNQDKFIQLNSLLIAGNVGSYVLLGVGSALMLVVVGFTVLILVVSRSSV